MIILTFAIESYCYVVSKHGQLFSKETLGAIKFRLNFDIFLQILYLIVSARTQDIPA